MSIYRDSTIKYSRDNRINEILTVSPSVQIDKSHTHYVQLHVYNIIYMHNNYVFTYHMKGSHNGKLIWESLHPQISGLMKTS